MDGMNAGKGLVVGWRAALAVLLLAAVGPAWGAAPAVTAVVDLGGAPGGAPPAVYRYGGGVWHVPGTFPWVAPQILDLPRVGTFRAALAWEVLAASDDMDDLKRRLADYRLNDFLRQVKARGGRVIITLDAMPRWLAADRSDRRLPDGPAWAKSPPQDYARWSDVVQAVVQHFNGDLGLDAWYEVWNEPDWSWRGTLDDYCRFYRATALGALRADPHARVGGPAISDWSATGTGKTRGSVAAGFFIQRWLDYAAHTALPDLKRQRLPVDFITWHGFYRQPQDHYRRIVTRMRQWAQAAGYGDVPLVVDEWNIAAEPPYPEGDINGNYIGAAFVGATLLAMADAGLDAQVFQMMVDPGGKGYSGGTFTPIGLPRANFQVFSLFARLQGRRLPVTTDNPWLAAAAYRDGKTLYVLVANFVPTPMMRMRALFEPLPLEDPKVLDELRTLPKDAVTGYFRNGRLPAGVGDEPGARQFLSRSRSAFEAFRDKRRPWGEDGVELTVRLAGGRADPAREVTRQGVSQADAIRPEALAAAQERILDRVRAALEDAGRQLREAGVPADLQARFSREMGSHFSSRATEAAAGAAWQAQIRSARATVDTAFRAALDREKAALRPVLPTPVATDLAGGDRVTLHVAADSVQLFRFTLR